MSESLLTHPLAADLIAYAYGEAANATIIEQHMRSCAACAEAVMLARATAVPPKDSLSPLAREQMKTRLRAGLAGRLVPSPNNSTASSSIAFGLAGGATLLGSTVSDPAPLVAANDLPDFPQEDVTVEQPESSDVLNDHQADEDLHSPDYHQHDDLPGLDDVSDHYDDM